MPKIKNQLNNLEAIYTQIPTIQCQGKCHENCSVVPMTKLERVNSQNQYKQCPTNSVQAINSQGIPEFICSCLDADGRCSIYNARPLICRLYGVAEGLECPYGCQPARRLSKQETWQLVLEVEKLSPGSTTKAYGDLEHGLNFGRNH